MVFENKPLNGIQIHKINADTRKPLEDVMFVVREKSGSVIGESTPACESTPDGKCTFAAD